MSKSNVVLLCMALSVACSGFADVAPGQVAAYLRAAGGVFTGIAALFLHPTGAATPPPSQDTATNAAVVPGKPQWSRQ